MKKYITPLTSTAYFIVVLLIVHLVWKFGFVEEIDLSGNKMITFFGLNATAFFLPMTNWLLGAVYSILSTCTSVSVEIKQSAIYLLSQAKSIEIVWSCTGLKQMIFFFLLILCYPKHSLHKLWFIPVGVIVVFLLNVLRITYIVYLCDADITRFDSLHEVSKYVFYGVMFLMWVLWDWVIVPDDKERQCI